MGRKTGWTHALWLGALALAMALTAVPAPVIAQDVFFTQSGGRGLQNAKMSARVSKVEADTKDLQAEMATIQPFAKKPIITCTNTADKLRWTGNDWLCDSETDPTVQAFAKKALPSCGAGQILSASGSEFNCAPSGFLSAETDPTVQAFAKSPLPDCGTGKVLSSSGSNLTCIADERGLTQETDPYVHVFARTETAISNCEAGKVLTMQGSRLNCVFDAVGITVETDPKVQPFAKNDIAGYTLNACAAGEVLTAVTQAGVTILKCETGTTVVGPIIASTDLDDLNDVTAPAPSADDVLRFVGGQWVNSSDKIGSLTANKWCHFTVAGDIVCDRDIPAPQPANACAAGQMVTWDNVGKVWSCSSLAAAISETLVLDQLADVSITVPVAGEGLTYTGTGWVNGYNSRIARYDTDVRTMDTSGGLGAVQIVVDGNSVLTASGTSIGIRTNTPTADLDVFGTISGTTIRFGSWISGPVIQASQYVSAASVHTSGTLMVSNTAYVDNLRVNGNTVLGNNLYVLGGLFVSGSQSIDGVVFANGGVSATGTISATRFVGDGSGLTGVAGGDRIVSGTTFAQATEDESITFVTAGSLRAIIGANGRVGVGTDDPETDVEVIGTISATNLHLSGNLTVSGSQIIDGVVFANGGVSATGSITATTFSGDGSGLTNVTANSMRWYGLTDIPAQVVAVSDGTAIQMVGVSATNVSVTANLTAAQVAASSGLFTTLAASSGSFGNVNASGYVSAASIHTSGTVRVSNTLRADDLASVATTRVGTDLYVGGNLYVSGSQSIDGVMFANGGVSATGTVTATSFSGDGSLLTGVAADWYGLLRIPTQVVAVSDGTAISMQTVSATAINGQYISGTQGYFPVATISALSAGSIGANIVSSSLVSATNVSATLVDATRDGTVSGTYGYFRYISGTSVYGTFVGDGSGLTGVTAGSSDRIVSGTTAVYANNASGYVSFTSGGVTTGWYSPSGIFAAVGVSTTGKVSAVEAFVTGNLGVGITSPNAKVDVDGVVSATGLAITGNQTLSGNLTGPSLISSTYGGLVSATYGYFRNISATYLVGDGSGITNINANAITGLNLDRIVSGTANAIAHQNTGISVSVPLDVAGPVKVAGSGSESCAAGAYGSIRLNPVTGAIQVCRQ